MNKAFINGTFCDLADAKISIFDRGFLFGDAVYEVLPVYNGTAFFVNQHLDRLAKNLSKIKIMMPELDWYQLIQRLIMDNGGDNLQIYIQVTRGNKGMRKHDIPHSIQPSVIAFTLHNSFPTQADKEKGLTAKVIEDNRWSRCDIKTTSLLANILLNDQAISSGYQTSILIREGFITEGSTSNIFIVSRDGTIQTPPLTTNCLPGITRQVAITLINKLNWNFLETEITLQNLFEAQEVWITSTTKEIFPVVQIDQSLVNRGVVGKYWTVINQSYMELIS